MSDKNKQVKQETSQPAEENKSTKSFSWKRLLAKKWVYPAVYLAAAAIILSIMWATYQDSDNVITENELGLTTTAGENAAVDGSQGGPDAMPVTGVQEKMIWPVKDRSEVDVIMPFYDESTSNEEKQAAMIQYGDTFMPNVGISLSREDDEPFEVIAAMSGTVTRSEQLPVVGYVVEITHENDLKTIYQSLANVQVKEGDEVRQGDVIGEAGRNEIGKDLGNHVHFEIHRNGEPVNPEEFIENSAENSENSQ
jgi:stage II sporulation protein Q